MAESKLSVILYEDTIDALIDMPEETMAKVMKAILCNAKGMVMPELDPLETIIFRLLYGQVERAGSLSKKRSEAGSSKKGKQTDANGEQNPANHIKRKQIVSNDEQIETNPNTITSTSTSTITNTITNTETSTSTCEREDDAANVVYLTPEPEFTGQEFVSSPPDEKKDLEKIFSYWRENIGEPLPALYRIVNPRIQEGMEPALICRGIELSVSAKNPMKYLNKVLNNWKLEGMTTLAAYEASKPSRNTRNFDSELGKPSYDLDEVNQLIMESAIKGASRLQKAEVVV